jgi:hypothetical protein
MRQSFAALLLIAACFEPTVADAAPGKHRHVIARGCAFEGRPYADGQFCSIACSGGVCATQTCHRGRWVIPTATCPRGFGCPAAC